MNLSYKTLDPEELFRKFMKLIGEETIINEYDIIPQQSDPFLLDNNNLAIDSSVAKALVCYTNFKYVDIVSQKKHLSPEGEQELLGITKCLLMFLFDHASAWNYRKEMLREKKLNPNEELTFSRLVLMKHPKSPETFNHRRYILKHYLEIENATNHSTGSCLKCNLLASELDLCLIVADRYRNNYCCWVHRIWSIEELSCDVKRVLENEIKVTQNYMTFHISDYPVYNHRHYIIVSLIRNNTSSSADHFVTFLLDELTTVNENLEFYSHVHESLWNHKRFLISILLSTLNTNSEKSRSLKSHAVDLNLKERFHCYCHRYKIGKTFIHTDLKQKSNWCMLSEGYGNLNLVNCKTFDKLELTIFNEIDKCDLKSERCLSSWRDILTHRFIIWMFSFLFNLITN